MPINHVVQAKYNTRLNKMMVLLSAGCPSRGDDIDVVGGIENCKAYMYKDVSIEVWEEFRAKEHGTESDVYWEIMFHNQHEEYEFPAVQFLMA